MFYQEAAVFLFVIQICISRALSHAIDVWDAKVFEIALDDMNYDEESENEMIQLADLADMKLAEDEDRYKPLHSHVKHYNERNVESKKQFSNVFPYLQPYAEEIFNLEQEDKPFIAGFKLDLDKHFTAKSTKQTFSNRKRNSAPNADKYAKRVIRTKRDQTEDHYATTLSEEMDFFQVIRDRNVTTAEVETTEHLGETQATYIQYDTYEYSQEITSEETGYISTVFFTKKSTLADTESPDEEQYDYEKFKMEYEQQLDNDIKRGKVLNYTEKKEDTPKKALERILDLKRPKNCTKEELSQIGIKAIKCLVYDYRRAKDVATMQKVLSRTWLVLRVWLLIYVCLAIPCWCQRGWCCCCFRCKTCFPQERILFAKQYYAMNPPGTFVKDLKKEEDVKEPIKYEATEYERDAYERFEAAIRNV